MAALAVCAITAAQARTSAPKPVLPSSPDEAPPAEPGLIALTVDEIKRLLNLATRRLHDQTHHLHWTWWHDATKPAPDGSTTAPASPKTPGHDQTDKCGRRDSEVA